MKKRFLKYEKVNNEKTELFDAIQKFREYRDKAIEKKYDYDKLIEREMEILIMEKEREKRKETKLRNERKHLYDNLKFEHKPIESALYNNIITYFVSQKLENKINIMIVIY